MRRRICSLASMLYKFTVQKFPTKLSWDILPFLHHFATLLTCDNNVDRKAKKVIAVTGSGAVEGIVPSCGELCRPVLVPAQLCRVPKLYFTENMEEVLPERPNDYLYREWTTVWPNAIAFFIWLNQRPPSDYFSCLHVHLFAHPDTFSTPGSMYNSDQHNEDGHHNHHATLYSSDYAISMTTNIHNHLAHLN
ncbi:hypothetical protein J3A83DRAFT_4401984 [Scleroderma citrinum]